ncbi:hypothetical protein ACFSW8_00640 [Rubritalea tangerina]|uniref:Uncharacterized protein n=2 Tax=Rubritalea tangerina TaxID=430798 RepID=A0ABW4Z673_9BACT
MKYISGVWNTENWTPRDANTKNLVTWLATIPFSNPKIPSEVDVKKDVAPYNISGSELITLLGEGTLGQAGDKADYVQVATIPVHTDGNFTGSYGYWVSDESLKASYGIQIKEDDKWADSNKNSSPYRSSLDAIDEVVFEQYFEKSKSEQINTPSLQTTELITPSAQKYFHHITNKSVSLLTNTRLGGLKSDLSTAFELDTQKFNELEEFHNSPERNNTDNYANLSTQYTDDAFYPSSHPLGYLFEVPSSVGTNSAVVRGPTWDLLRNYARLYKKEWDSFSWNRSIPSSNEVNFITRGSLPLSYATGSGDSKTHQGREYSSRSSPGGLYDSFSGNFKDIAEPISNGPFNPAAGTLRQTASRIAPSIIRVTMVLGVRKKNTGKPAPNDWRLALSFDPYVTIHNPYNRRIEFESIGMYASKFNPLRFNFEWTDNDGAPQKVENLMFSVNVGNNGSLAYRILPKSGETFILEPGEIKVLSPLPEGGMEQEYKVVKRNNMVEATFEYGEDTGLFMFPGGYYHYWNPPTIKPKSNTSVRITLSGRHNSFANRELDTFNFSLLSTKSHNGTTVKLNEIGPPYMQANKDIWDEDFITRITYSTYDDVSKADAHKHKLSIDKSFNESSLPRVGESGFYIGALDLALKNGAEGAPVFHQFNPRGQIYDLRNYDGSDRLSPAWNVELKDISDVSDLQLVGDPEGHGYWGLGRNASYGTSNVVLYDLPRAPLTSIAALTHADISIIPEDGSSQIANSFKPAGFVKSNQLTTRRPISTQYKAPKAQTLTDFSWASNEALWDQYFFSSINWGDNRLAIEQAPVQAYLTHSSAIQALVNDNDKTKSPLQNPRIIYEASQKLGDSIEDDMKDYAKIAKHLAIAGGFNINSTSVDAWKAILSSHNNLNVKYLNISQVKEDKNEGVPFSRFQLPAGTKEDIARSTNTWTGYRELSNDEITKLAESIVDQVKLRGPFMGVSDFVNRRLRPLPSPNTNVDVDKLGALQMAIEDAGLNEKFSEPITISNFTDTSINTGSKDISLSTLVGSPGYLMQSDVLQTIGSVIRTRGDTFTVRCYGDARDDNGKVVAQAWCEATIQRTTDWSENSSEPFKIPDPAYPTLGETDAILNKWVPNPSTTATNKTYGRKFIITSFKWLSSNEI